MIVQVTIILGVILFFAVVIIIKNRHIKKLQEQNDTLTAGIKLSIHIISTANAMNLSPKELPDSLYEAQNESNK